MKGETLVQSVTNILLKPVTEQEAKDFALNQYGVLCAYIRNKQISKMTEIKSKKPLNNKITFNFRSTKKH